MPVDETKRRALLDAIVETISAHAEELTEIDAAQGDGDHGLNMKRGFTAVMSKREAIVAKPLPEAMQEVGRTLVMTVGGASGVIFGTAFMAAGKALPEDPTRADAAAAMDAAVAAVRARGKADFGHKTMLDVLGPVAKALRDPAADIAAAALAAAEATAGMQAIRGRASFLAERSVGGMDAGARSAALIIVAICSAMGDRA
ncbi:MAG: dihydroxyacetone kinase subunit L [Proteobacteria bacterium]|nr:dihydroxyacetone kinase subunit L [Pseudomonadota bacterium]